ncbi:hypothetical protein GCM10007939_10100 [Amylibacter marinus]|uniref:Multidrug efflux pump n=1 Tax=Amylibacter marinus TaxID=1475483 RepID=A0ABQ5VU78_9RHOB|nr:efflux RND transporter permease subunit [Amylibacter marinus]GLQ34727.1 hypothetical protein GCM10007939_10100 [Amylibacter marinus]
MTGLIDWATTRARMIIVFILMSLTAGTAAYFGLPKEGEPDIDIPALFVSVPFPGISAEDSEKLLVKPLENKLKELDGLKTMSATAAEGYGGIALEFEFGWDKTATIADVRDKANQAAAEFPDGADQYTINEINFSEFPILVVSLSGQLPERTMNRVAKDLQDKIEAMPEVLEAGLAGQREEMLEVLIDPLKLEAYNVTAGELINVVTNNNLLIAAGEIESDAGAFAIKIPSSFSEPQDVYNLPVKVNGDRVITLLDLAEIRLTFEDRLGTARFNGETTVAIQVVKRKGVNLIGTVELVKEMVDATTAEWPDELKNAITINYSSDQSRQVGDMVSQLEGSVLTAIALVMIVVLAALGVRSALLVGFAIPTSFLLAFAIMGATGITISNMVMFGLILAVGMLVDGAIVVVEYADKRISEGVGPMQAYGAAAKRMFWPIVSSTATTLCAFLPMLFWPGVPGEFMGMLPVTLIYVLGASLLVALIYLPVVGGVAGRLTRFMENTAERLRARAIWQRVILVVVSIALIYFGGMMLMKGAVLLGTVLFILGCLLMSVSASSLRKAYIQNFESAPNFYSRFIQFIVGKWYMPIVVVLATVGFVFGTFTTFGSNNHGVEFFVTTEPENAIIYVRARGNLSLAEKDALVRDVERRIEGIDGLQSAFAFAGDGGLNNNTGGASAPLDTIGQIQIETTPWEERQGTPSGFDILAEVEERIKDVPGVQVEILELAQGPASGKPLTLRVLGDNFEDLKTAAGIVRAHYEAIDGPVKIEDTRPLPGIDWKIDVDVEKAGRYNADVAQVGAMVQLVTRGLKLGNMTTDTSDEDIDIRVRLPEKDRLLSTLETLRIRTSSGLIPISNFITLTPVEKLGQIDRVDSVRYFDIKADVAEGVNAIAKIAEITEWLEAEQRLPAGIEWKWQGDQEDQAESQAFLGQAFSGALALMFVILLAQFNSFYNSVLVLLAVVLSTTGVLIGMMIMAQPFSVIMTGTGIVALAGIVVNNNIVLIDTYQEYSRRMPQIEAIYKTAQARIRPVILTTLTTMAGLTPMMLGISINFADGGYTIDQPTALWWKQLATAVVFGLGVATVLTLVLTPSLLALRIWVMVGLGRIFGFTPKA